MITHNTIRSLSKYPTTNPTYSSYVRTGTVHTKSINQHLLSFTKTMLAETRSFITESHLCINRLSHLQKAVLKWRKNIHNLLYTAQDLIDDHYDYYRQNQFFPSATAHLTRELTKVFHLMSRSHIFAPTSSSYDLGFSRTNEPLINKTQLSEILDIDTELVSFEHRDTTRTFLFGHPPSNGSLGLLGSLAESDSPKPYSIIFNKKTAHSLGFLPSFLHELGHLDNLDVLDQNAICEQAARATGRHYREILSPLLGDMGGGIYFDTFEKSSLLIYHVEEKNLSSPQQNIRAALLSYV